MAWNIIRQDIVWSDDMGCLPGMVNLYPNRKVRVTIEEEVNKCCEKWRRDTFKTTNGDRWLRSSFCDPVGPINCCPECGKKL